LRASGRALRDRILTALRDESADEKMPKATARNMAIMVKEINAPFADGKEHVSCFTCH
jgi:hypothetical protein